jgi:hypothetical protein
LEVQVAQSCADVGIDDRGGWSVHLWVWMRWGALLAALAASALLAQRAAAVPQSCRDWRSEHRSWTVEAVQRYLFGAPQSSLDAAVFEMLQREAYLTSCDVTVAGARAEWIGWRLIGRAPDDYGSAVLESILARAGFELDLRRWLPD